MPSFELKQLKKWLRDVEKSVKDYEKSDLQEILTKGAAPVQRAAKARVKVRGERETKNKIGTKLNPRYRYKGSRQKARKGAGRPIAYYEAGNLKKSISILGFSGSRSVFVGPYFQALRKANADVLKGSKSNDGYYAAMAYGKKGSKVFRSKVLVPSANSSAIAVKKEISGAIRKSIIKRSGKGV